MKVGKSIEILCVDPSPIFLAGVAQALKSESAIALGAVAADAETAHALIEGDSYDVILAELNLPDKSGFDFIRDTNTKASVLVFSFLPENEYAERALAVGARGFLEKSAPPNELEIAIRTVTEGDIYLSPAMTAKLLKRQQEGASALDSIERLTNREFQVFDLIGRGMRSKQIASILNISLKTVETHRSHIVEKLGISGPSLIHYAGRWFERTNSAGGK